MKVSAHKLDLSDVQRVQEFYSEVLEAHGRTVDILVSNAGEFGIPGEWKPRRRSRV